jgi:predicted N-acyltransferase
VGLEDQVTQLFESTLHHSRVDYGDFQRLGADYFSHVLHHMGDNAQLMLCWRDRDLVSFQLSLVGDDRVVTKHIGMRYPAARELSLYFLNWLKLIEFAIERRIPCIDMGATTYATKLLFGAHLERRWLHFRFRRSVSNAIFSPLGRWLDFESNDRELKALGSALENRWKRGRPRGESAAIEKVLG